jgi:hypothetical protein
VEDKDLAQLVREFVEALGLYLKQQGRDLVTEITMKPLRRAGAYLLALTAVTCLLALGIVFVGVGAAMGLTQALGSSAAAFGLMGVVLLLGAFVTYRLAVARKGRKGDGEDVSSEKV